MGIMMDRKNNNQGYEMVTQEQVSDLVKEQFESLYKLKENVKMAAKKAEAAQISAKDAKEKPAGWFQKKEAIESLQDATVELADAQIAATEAQEVSFEYQQKLGEMAKLFLGLGVTSIAINRTFIKELESKLKCASEDELDENARQELIGVIKQLKNQEDFMKKHEDLSNIVHEHHLEIKAGKRKDDEHDKLFEAKAVIDKSQNIEISNQAKKDTEHDEKIEKLLEIVTRQGDEISKLKDMCSRKKLNNSNLLSLIALAISAISLIAVILNYFL